MNQKEDEKAVRKEESMKDEDSTGYLSGVCCSNDNCLKAEKNFYVETAEIGYENTLLPMKLEEVEKVEEYPMQEIEHLK